jgi:hypothetical protein
MAQLPNQNLLTLPFIGKLLNKIPHGTISFQANHFQGKNAFSQKTSVLKELKEEGQLAANCGWSL